MYRGPLARRRRWGVPLRWGRRTRLPQAVPGRPGRCWYRLTLPATCYLSATTPTTTPITSSRLEPPGRSYQGIEPPGRRPSSQPSRSRRGKYRQTIPDGITGQMRIT